MAKTVDFGVYLAEDKNAGQEDRVLLPAKQVPEGTREGDALDAFYLQRFQGPSYCNHQRTTSSGWTDCCSESASGNQDRCIPGLGLRERPAPSIP